MRRGACGARSPARSAGDEIGDLSRSFSSVLDAARRSTPAIARTWRAGCRTSCARRSPWSARRSTTCGCSRCPDEARVYIERAQGGLQRLAEILTRMTEATRLEQSLHDVERERFDLGALVHGLRRRLSARVSASGRSRCDVPVAPLLDRRRAGPHRANAGQARRQRARIRAAGHADRDPPRGAGRRRAPRRWRTRARRCRRACASACSIRWCRCGRERAATSRISASGFTSCGSSPNSTAARRAPRIARTAKASR